MNTHMSCKDAQALFSSYLDGELSGAQMHAIAAHLGTCGECHTEYKSLVQTQALVARLGSKPVPADLALKIRVAAAQQSSITFHRRMQGMLVRWENAFNAFMLPATGGLVTALVMLGVFVGFFAQPQVSKSDDVPTVLYMPPRLNGAPFVTGAGLTTTTGPVVIEAEIDSSGRLADYRIIAGDDTREVHKELNRTLIFTTFAPAISFGQPTHGRVVLSFSNVSVKG